MAGDWLISSLKKPNTWSDMRHLPVKFGLFARGNSSMEGMLANSLLNLLLSLHVLTWGLPTVGQSLKLDNQASVVFLQVLVIWHALAKWLAIQIWLSETSEESPDWLESHVLLRFGEDLDYLPMPDYTGKFKTYIDGPTTYTSSMWYWSFRSSKFPFCQFL